MNDGDPGMDEQRIPHSGRLDVVVASALGTLSRAQAARLIRQGRVQVSGKVVARPGAKVHAGETLQVDVPPPTPSRVMAQDLPLSVVHEDADLAIIDKVAGMVVHPAPGHADGTLVNALLHHLDGLSGIGGVERPGIVHRLDRGTSGLIAVAKHDQAHQHLAAQFAAHTAGRVYLAICHGGPEEDSGTVQSTLGRHPKDRLRMASVDQGRHAITHWRVVGRAEGASLLQVQLETGRTHQVRVHMSEQGWPLLGDRLYRRKGIATPPALRDLVDPQGERPLLHAWQLRLAHPRSEAPMHVVAPPPADVCAVLERLGIPCPHSADQSGVHTP